jgi:hypothetical protein
VKSIVVAIALAAFAGCTNDSEQNDAVEQNAVAKPLTAVELASARTASRRSYEQFIKEPSKSIQAGLSSCQGEILQELKRQHLNAMIADRPDPTIADMKRDASDELKRLAHDPAFMGFDTVSESVNFCTFDEGSKVQRGSASCEFKDGKYARHSIGETTTLPSELDYVCDGYGL